MTTFISRFIPNPTPGLFCFALAIFVQGGCSPSGGGALPFPDVPPVGPCDNGVKDLEESDVDCGGTCGACAEGSACIEANDCATGLCANYVCRAAQCKNGTQDLGETGVDCGGPCPACVGEGCGANTDCASGYCLGGQCDVATCSDGVTNGSETGVDCGGNCNLCTVRGRRVPERYGLCLRVLQRRLLCRAELFRQGSKPERKRRGLRRGMRALRRWLDLRLGRGLHLGLLLKRSLCRDSSELQRRA